MSGLSRGVELVILHDRAGPHSLRSLVLQVFASEAERSEWTERADCLPKACQGLVEGKAEPYKIMLYCMAGVQNGKKEIYRQSRA
jgi:hypothetical protein